MRLRILAPGPSAQAVLLSAAMGMSQLAVAVTYILAARWSEPSEYGLVVSAVAVGIVCAGVFDFGANSLWVRELASGRLNRRDASDRAGTKLLLAAVLAATGGWMAAAFGSAPTFWVSAPIAFATAAVLVLQVPLRAAAQSHLMAIGIVGGRFAGIGLLLVLSATGTSPVDALWLSLVVGSVIEAAIHVVVTPASLRYIGRGFSLQNPWRASGHYGLYGIAISAQGLDVPLLTALSGASSGGMYGAVNRWTQPLGVVIAAYTSVTMPFVARARHWQEAVVYLKSGLWIPALAVSACVVAAAGAPWLVPLLLGDEYAAASEVLTLLALGTIPAIANQPIAVFLQALGYDAMVTRIIGAGVIGRLALVALLAASLGATGAALAFSMSQLAMCTVLLVTFKRVMRRWRAHDDL